MTTTAPRSRRPPTVAEPYKIKSVEPLIMPPARSASVPSLTPVQHVPAAQ